MSFVTYISLVADPAVYELLTERYGEGLIANATRPPVNLQSAPYKLVRFSFIDNTPEEYARQYLADNRTRMDTPVPKMMPHHITGYNFYKQLLGQLKDWFQPHNEEQVRFAKIKLVCGIQAADKVIDPSKVLGEQTFTKRDDDEGGDGFRQVPPSSPNGIKQPVQEYSVSGSRRSRMIQKLVPTRGVPAHV